MKFSKCFTVPESDKITESYKRRNNAVFANISDEKMENIISSFIEFLDEPCFFLIEVPLNKKDEEAIRKKDTDPYHKVEYFIDNIDKLKCFELFNEYGRQIIDSGLYGFGFGSIKSHDEIYVSRYNIVHFYSDNDITSVIEILNRNDIFENNEFITAYDIFSREKPGIIEKKSDFDPIDFINKHKYLGIYPSRIVDDNWGDIICPKELINFTLNL